MKKIESFQVNHLDLLRGIYVSRKDTVSGTILTTFDIRMKQPNKEPVLNTAEIHTIEHLGATFLRNHDAWKDKVIYFGPMGCRTGFYLILAGEYTSSDITGLMRELYLFVSEFEDEVPGADPVSCGNYLDMNLPMARYEAKKFYSEVLSSLTEKNLNYPPMK